MRPRHFASAAAIPSGTGTQVSYAAKHVDRDRRALSHAVVNAYNRRRLRELFWIEIMYLDVERFHLRSPLHTDSALKIKIQNSLKYTALRSTIMPMTELERDERSGLKSASVISGWPAVVSLREWKWRPKPGFRQLISVSRDDLNSRAAQIPREFRHPSIRIGPDSAPPRRGSPSTGRSPSRTHPLSLDLSGDYSLFT